MLRLATPSTIEYQLPPRFREPTRIGGAHGVGVYRAYDLQSQRFVAIKVLPLAEANGGFKAIEAFEREAKTLRTLHHVGIPRYIEHFSDDSGTHFLVMEYVEGPTLATAMEEGRRFTDGELRSILLRLAETLRYLQELNPPVFHRDIKPENVLLAPAGRVVLVDFSSVRDPLVSDSLTNAGTIGYMAPELIESGASPRSEIFSLGATIAAAATGLVGHRLPRKTAGIMLDRVMRPSALRAIVQQMLHHEPRRRFANIRALQQAMSRPIRVTVADPPAAAAKPPAPPPVRAPVALRPAAAKSRPKPPAIVVRRPATRQPVKPNSYPSMSSFPATAGAGAPSSMMVADPTQSFVRTMDILFVGTPVLAMSAVIPATLSLMFHAIPVTLMYVLFVVWTLGLCALHRVLR